MPFTAPQFRDLRWSRDGRYFSYTAQEETGVEDEKTGRADSAIHVLDTSTWKEVLRIPNAEDAFIIPSPPYPPHLNITSTIFWIGEEAGKDGVSNIASAWDDDWMQHYGGADDPANRKGYYPAAFTPKGNPFYCALPYNDFRQGKRKPDANQVIPWFGEQVWGKRESICKNRWVAISKGKKTAYAQWEDVGPFNTDDSAYVFGCAQPKNQAHRGAGIDVSPAVRDYLGLEDIDSVDWRFVDAKDIPAGPWNTIVTRSQITWQ